MAGAVPMEVRRERNRILRELGEARNQAFRERFIGRTVSAVTLEQPKAALTTNFLRMDLDRDVVPNQLIEVEFLSDHLGRPAFPSHHAPTVSRTNTAATAKLG
jgi:tRNA A37 methylthiotransferase MiaB